MHVDLSSACMAVCAMVSVYFLRKIIDIYRVKRKMPPSPPGLPILGNLFQLGGFQWLRFTEWKEKYGPLFSLSVCGINIVVINDFTTAGDLLERRSSIYSDRPRQIMVNEVMTDGTLLSAAHYGSTWRRLRRAAHTAFNANDVKQFRPTQELEALLLLSRLIQDPEQWYNHLRVSAGSIVLSVLYGWDPKKIAEHQGTVKRVNEWTDRLLKVALPGAYLVEFIPWMLYIPTWLAPWKREGYAWRRKDTSFYTDLVEDVERRMQSGEARNCFVSSLLENQEALSIEKRELAWLAGVMFAAGAETTAGVMIVFFLAMILYPDVMQRAQSQIDTVVGRDRFPTFDDMEKLPYIVALIHEALRWRPPLPLSLPKRCMEDNFYNGFFIPGGTLVIENVWAMNHDPKYFPDHDVFRPERYLDSSGCLSDPIADTHGYGHHSFGSGRRICVGRDLANQSLFINIATLLWAVNIRPRVNGKGDPILPSPTDVEDVGLVVRPLPFKCTIEPRSPTVLGLLESLL